MNNKMNKKGFTLIEMLVVIAIIAILVAIIIPIVGSSTKKAKAAADAANLRSMKAEATTLYLSGKSGASSTNVKYEGGTTFSVLSGAPTAQTAEVAGEDAAFNVETNGDITITYGGKDIAYFADLAK